MKKILLTLLVGVMFLSGCSNKTAKVSGEKKDNNASVQKLNEKIEELNKSNERLSKDIDELKKEKKYLENKNEYYLDREFVKEKKLSNMVSIVDILKQNKASNYDIMPIYTADVDTVKKQIGYYILIPKNKSIKQKLDIIADNVSEMYFGNLPIKVVEIKNVNGKKIAFVNLKELKQNENIEEPLKLKEPTWKTGYFQGSTGGAMTEVTLVNSFLQQEYKGEWIDGVKFTYENKNIEYQHVARLDKIIYESFDGYK